MIQAILSNGQSFFLKPNKETYTGIAVFFAAMALFAIDWKYSLSDWDFHLRDGVSTIGAERVLAGEIPHKDFWTMYAPGQFYLLAVFFRLFGTHLMVEVIVASLVSAIGALLSYLLAKKLLNQRLIAVEISGVFISSMYYTGYFKRLGSYPPAIVLTLLALIFVTYFYQTNNSRYLFFSGASTGISILFKHDIGFYTSVAIYSGIFFYHLFVLNNLKFQRFLRHSLSYFGPTILFSGPILLSIAISAGQPMIDNLIVFPLTDFRFARPEYYPGLFPIGVFNGSPILFLQNLTDYLNHTSPFILFLIGLIGIGLSVRENKANFLPIQITLAIGFIIHYEAAHVQINTHLVTMSIYAALLGSLFYILFKNANLTIKKSTLNIVGGIILAGWILSFSVKPIYRQWQNRIQQTATLNLTKVSGMNVSPIEARALHQLSEYVDENIPTDQPLYVGLHRHDVIVVGDIMSYFIFDHPLATRYQELHPAIADTSEIQEEIIQNLRDKNVSLIVLKHIFSDEALEVVKADFQKNLPKVGALNLDQFIHQNYSLTRSYGPYDVWIRN